MLSGSVGALGGDLPQSVRRFGLVVADKSPLLLREPP